MRWLLCTIVFLGTMMTLRAETYVYVSVGAPEPRIHILKLDAKSGMLTPVADVSTDGAPGSLGVDPSKHTLVASLRTNSMIASYRLDQGSGQLKHLSTAPLGKNENAAYVAVDRSGKYLLSASYMGGKVVVHGLGGKGMIQSPALQTIETAKTAHCIAIDKENRWVFVPHVAPNAVYQFRLDAATGKLTEAGKASGSAEKAGPRHLAFHPKMNLAFTSDETGSSITAYQFDAETGLKPVQTLSTLPADFKGKNTTAEVKVHPNGKFVWVSNRGHDSLAGFAIDPSGKLTSLGQAPTEKTPRSFEIDPDGRYVFGAGEGTGKLAVYQVNQQSGALERIHTVDLGSSLTWVMAVKVE